MKWSVLKSNGRNLMFLALIMFLAGCASAKSQVAPYAFYPPVDENYVYVYHNYPPVPYEVIGEISGRGYSYSKWDSIYKQMKKKAAGIGGNGIVIISETTPVIATQHIPATVNVSTSSPQNSQNSQNDTSSTANTLSNMNATASYSPARTEEITEKVVSGVVIRFKQKSPGIG